jgi:hypothetical protein
LLLGDELSDLGDVVRKHEGVCGPQHLREQQQENSRRGRERERERERESGEEIDVVRRAHLA